jgi:chromosome segregation ATPase
MATTTTTVGNRCVKCDKSNAILKCGGCLQDFCYNHLLEHRQELSKRLDDIEINCDLIRQSINQQSAESEEHPLMKQIDQWEQESIDKIKQTAEETRKVVLEYTNEELNKYTNQVELKLNNLTDRLKQSRNENDFLETNLNEWDKQLTQLKEELNKSSNIKIGYDSTRFITRIYVDIPSKLN